jgi:predicted transcriptional regulator
MCTILLSINPQYVERIMSGDKIYEFRKTRCKESVDKIIIYSTSPVMKVVGEADVADVLVDEPQTIWKITEKKSGIDKHFFDKYYSGKEQAVAYKLKHIIQYDVPRKLSEYGIKTAPQSFCYVKVSV